MIINIFNRKNTDLSLPYEKGYTVAAETRVNDKAPLVDFYDSIIIIIITDLQVKLLRRTRGLLAIFFFSPHIISAVAVQSPPARV